MTNRRTAGLAWWMLLLLLLLPARAAAQDRDLAGRYIAEGDGAADIERAIRATVASMNFIVRPIARSRLRRTNPVSKHLIIELPPGHAIFTFDASTPMISPLDGSNVRWIREDGETFELRTRWDGPTLVQMVTAPDGTRTTRFESSGGERLILHIAVESPRLPRALQYELVYRRTGSE